jgi:dTDP-4-amino-4,6-dideoxygalactose transaminase
VIEDAAQAIGSEYKGRRAGSMGRYGCFSFFPSKNLGAAGDGGMVVARDAAVAEKLRVLRVHGSKPKYYHAMIGGNFRFDSLQAAVIAVKLKYLDRWTAGRQSNAARYRRLFEAAGLSLPSPNGRGAGGEGLVQLPYEVPGNRHIYNQFVVRVPRRDELQAYLREQKIGNEVYYPVPLHVQQCFAYLGHREGDFPESEKAARETLALPIYPELSDQQAQWVVECVRTFLKK